MLKECVRKNKDLFKDIIDDINVEDLDELMDIICYEITSYEENCYTYELSIFRLLDFINDMFIDGILCNKNGDTIECSEFISFEICSTILNIYRENILD